MSSSTPVITHAHFIGSLGTNSAEESFELASTLANNYKRLPDGEFSERWYWLQFQTKRLDKVEGLERVGDEPIKLREFDQRPFALKAGVQPSDINFGNLGYADAAISSYEVFAKKQKAGEIPADVRFQVSLPTPLAVIGAFIHPDSRKALLPEYTKALKGEIERFAAAIPHNKLAIQWDIAVEFLYIEEVGLFGQPAPSPDWFGGRALEDSARLLAEAIAWVKEKYPKIDVGIHLCYGDVEESHFKQPEDTTNLVAFANEVIGQVPEDSLAWIHLPVPIERDDEAYFAPLAKLKLPKNTELFLGLIHREDGIEGIARRAKAAAAFVPAFGVSTECGFGRAPKDAIKPLFALHNVEKIRQALDA